MLQIGERDAGISARAGAARSRTAPRSVQVGTAPTRSCCSSSAAGDRTIILSCLAGAGFTQERKQRTSLAFVSSVARTIASEIVRKPQPSILQLLKKQSPYQKINKKHVLEPRTNSPALQDRIQEKTMSRLASCLTICFIFVSSDAALAAAIPHLAAPMNDPNVTQVYGGCGPYGHRGPAGYCRPGGQAGGYVPGYSCPRGFHVGPYGRHCWPN